MSTEEGLALGTTPLFIPRRSLCKDAMMPGAMKCRSVADGIRATHEHGTKAMCRTTAFVHNHYRRLGHWCLALGRITPAPPRGLRHRMRTAMNSIAIAAGACLLLED